MRNYDKSPLILKQDGKSRTQNPVSRLYRQFIQICICSLMLMFIPFIISCTDPVAKKKKHLESGISYLEKNELRKAVIEFKLHFKDD